MGGRYSKQKMVLGTHTSEGEQNYLMLAEVRSWTLHLEWRWMSALPKRSPMPIAVVRRRYAAACAAICTEHKELIWASPEAFRWYDVR